MLTENQLEMLGDKAAELMQEAEQDIIADIARRIKRQAALQRLRNLG